MRIRDRITLSARVLCLRKRVLVPFERANLVFPATVMFHNSRGSKVWGTKPRELAPTVSLIPGGARRQRIDLIRNEDRKGVRNTRTDIEDS